MWFWKRREVYHGFSLKEQAEVRELLKAYRIKYDYRVVNLAPNKRLGSYGINKDYETEYYIYVSKKDYGYVSHLLGK